MMKKRRPSGPSRGGGVESVGVKRRQPTRRRRDASDDDDDEDIGGEEDEVRDGLDVSGDANEG